MMAGRKRLATVAIESGRILAGRLTPQQHREVRRILILMEHREAALAAFEAGIRHESVARLDDRGRSER